LPPSSTPLPLPHPGGCSPRARRWCRGGPIRAPANAASTVSYTSIFTRGTRKAEVQDEAKTEGYQTHEAGDDAPWLDLASLLLNVGVGVRLYLVYRYDPWRRATSEHRFRASSSSPSASRCSQSSRPCARLSGSKPSRRCTRDRFVRFEATGGAAESSGAMRRRKCVAGERFVARIDRFEWQI
jgi:hypothetical protein